jgi:hypothetical protein
VLPTIRSRTHHYPFRLIPPRLLSDYLSRLCVEEGVAIEPAALPLVVRAGGGSARDTLSALDQVSAMGGVVEQGQPVEAILAGNVYHRTVILGRERANRIDGLRARVLRDGEPIGETDDVLELTGDPEALVRLVRETAGDAVRAGDVVITGSVVPPIAVAPGQTVRYDLLPLGSLTVTLG